MNRTHLAQLVQRAMDEQNGMSLGDVERRGGPSKQTLGRLLSHWKGERSLHPETLPKLSKALGISQRSLGRAAAVDMGLLPVDEARDDGLALLVDALRERASEQHRDLVVAAARAVWQVVEKMDAAGGAVEKAAEDKRLKAKLKREAAVRAGGPQTVAKRPTKGIR